MIKFLSKCFTFKGIFSLRDYRKGPVIALFLILVFVTSFPLNMAIIKNNGWKSLNTITYSWRQALPKWLPDELPNDWTISKNGLEIPNSSEATYVFESDNSVGMEGVKTRLVINPMEKETGNAETVYTKNEILIFDESGNVKKENYERTIVLCKNEIIYYGVNNQVLKGGYNNVKTPLNFTYLKLLGKEGAIELLDAIDGSFSEMMIFSNIAINTGTQLILNIIFVLVEAAIFMLVRIKYQKVTTFSQNINIVIASMVIPSLISFLAGILNIIEFSSFTVVLFQLFAPLIAIGAIYKGSNITDPNIKFTT